ncbi:radical SAM protein [Methylotuvimicrobium buryatense]|uniref:Radical SAM protein n=1 Tax=Methylotuvimicrobium buryatense TaxID=95641 RepID=A0A4P9UP30_METBY|nr:radical SAM protein [Methylotuvimicrobium buryatense]QCW83108.1 radical SAM protein [Methylotuvimicrobium buryatense]
MTNSVQLTTTDHSRDSVGLTYIYPVLSRRSGGLSIGVNFNINNACNWRCIYCQVPDLTLGAAPPIDFPLLEKELRRFLSDVLHGDFFDRFQVGPPNRVIKDIAISGNGEPTSAKDFDKAVDLIGRVATEMGVLSNSGFVLISNGSLMHQPKVQDGLRSLHRYGGEVWFKFDSATDTGRNFINNAAQTMASALRNLKISAAICQTKIQTCLVDYSGQGLTDVEKNAYLQFLTRIKNDGVAIDKIMLYTIARPSMQPEAAKMRSLSPEVMRHFADEIRALGFEVRVDC